MRGLRLDTRLSRLTQTLGGGAGAAMTWDLSDFSKIELLEGINLDELILSETGPCLPSRKFAVCIVLVIIRIRTVFLATQEEAKRGDFVRVFRRRPLCESSLCARIAILLTEESYSKYTPILTIYGSKWALRSESVRFWTHSVHIRGFASKYMENRSSGWKDVVAFSRCLLISNRS